MIIPMQHLFYLWVEGCTTDIYDKYIVRPCYPNHVKQAADDDTKEATLILKWLGANPFYK